jgi:predicted nucleotidyltransferase component of viral defense system
LLAQYLEIGRETTDADFLMTKIKNEAKIIEDIMIEIVGNDNIADGFSFSFSRIEELSQPHMEYAGFRVSLNGLFEKMKDKIQLDIGFGDIVVPEENNFRPFEYKGKPMFEGEITLQVYPVETIFAEKLETIISKGAFNSRMKDYHDVLLMIREKDLLHIELIKKSVRETFKNRNTEMKLPIKFDEAGIESLQRLWSGHLRGLGKMKLKLNFPDDFNEVLKEINGSINWLK